MPEPIAITVLGQPAPQGSKRAFAGKRKDGTTYKGVIESSHDRVKSWRQAIIDEAKAQNIAGLRLAGPLAVTMAFAWGRPKSHYGTGRNAQTLKPSAPEWPIKPPDLSKLVRATEDALSDAGVWEDDAQVTELTACKLWTGGCVVSVGGRLTPIELPGAIITIQRQVTS